jgi:hypothetical protein
MRLVVRGKLFPDPRQPFVEQRRRTRVQRRKRSDHARLALRDHQIRHGNDEQRRADHGDRQTALEQSGHGHRKILLSFSGKRNASVERCQTSYQESNRNSRPVSMHQADPSATGIAHG